jgi:hypothetical protein
MNSADFCKISNDQGETEQEAECTTILPLSDYAKQLENTVKRRYLIRENITGGDRSGYADRCEVRARMFATDRKYRSPVLSGNGHQLLHKAAIQSLQKFRGLQPNGFRLYHQRTRQNIL